MKNLNLEKAMEMFNIEVKPVVKEDGLTAEDKAMTQMILDNLDSIEATMDQEEDFLADLESFIEESEKLHTAELLRIEQEHQLECDRNIAMLKTILEDEEASIKYGNKTIKRHREIAPILNKVSTGCNKSLVEITMDSYGCTYAQAVSKLAQKLNINYDHDTWFKTQLEIIESNRRLIENPTDIVIKYPQLWNKMKQDAHMRKYFMFLLDLFQTQLEQKGVSHKGGNKPLIASASFGFASKSLRVGYRTVYNNMNSLAMFGATKKLTDKQVKKIDESRYESIMSLRRNEEESTITTYELILWTDEVLKAMNDIVIEKQRTRTTHAGQCHMMLDSIGFGDVINKSEGILTEEDKLIIAELKSWARQKVYKSNGCGFITMNDIEERFTKIKDRYGIIVRKDKRNKYITRAMADLGLSYEYVSKELKSIINSKKLNKLNSGKVWVPADKADKLNKYN